MDRKWFPMGRYHRRGNSWLCSLAKPSPTGGVPSNGRAPQRIRRSTAKYDDDGHNNQEGGSKVEDCLVFIGFDTPFKVDGLASRQYKGVGLVIDRAQGEMPSLAVFSYLVFQAADGYGPSHVVTGLVLTDRQTAPVGLADVLINIGGIRKVPAEVVFIHPLINLSVLKYNPEDLVGAGVYLGEASISDAHPGAGDSLILHGLSDSFEPIRQQCTVTSSKLINFPDAKPPQFVASTTEMLQIGQMNTRYGGVFEGEDGKVVGLVQSFSYRLEVSSDIVLQCGSIYSSTLHCFIWYVTVSNYNPLSFCDRVMASRKNAGVPSQSLSLLLLLRW